MWSSENETNLVSMPKHLMVQETSNRRESLLSPRRTKQSRGINCKNCDDEKLMTIQRIVKSLKGRGENRASDFLGV